MSNHLALKENDSVRLILPAPTIDRQSDGESILVSAGEKGAIVAVLGDPSEPRAYLVEIHLEKFDEFVVVEAQADSVELIWSSPV